MFTNEETDPAGLEALATSLGVTAFDLMVVGDGAGNLADTPFGWACASYARSAGEVRWLWGGGSGGTNNVAELEPSIHAVNSHRAALLADYLDRSKNGKQDFTPPSVLIVSDSEMTVKCGQGVYERKANAPLWASVDWLEKKGYRLQWRWVPRNSNPFNLAADRMAKAVRAAMAVTNLRG